MKFSSFIVSALLLASSEAFVVPRAFLPRPCFELNAIGVLARKAKEAEVRTYCQDGIEDDVMDQYNAMKAALEQGVDLNNDVGPIQELLTRRKGTITIVAEYKRKLEGSDGYIDEIFDPQVLSPTFRDFGASAISVLADERMGGCSYDDIQAFVEEQRRSQNDVPGPLMVINNDLIVDEIQIARTAAYGAKAVVLNMAALGGKKVEELLKATKALELEAIVAVASKEEAQTAIDIGGRIISVVGVFGADDKAAVIESLKVPDGAKVCTVANIMARDNKEFEEIEEAWTVRDKGFNCVWVSDALYKGGSNAVEHPGAVINSMKAKSSVKWASPKARSGKGEGAKEYLGDIMM